jgi:hypothetical protein
VDPEHVLAAEQVTTVNSGPLLIFQPNLPVQEKLQWFQNFGYCGETSLIMAGQQYGNWMGQFNMRGIVTGGQTINCPANGCPTAGTSPPYVLDRNTLSVTCPSSSVGGCQAGEQSQLLPGANEGRIAATLRLNMIDFNPGAQNAVTAALAANLPPGVVLPDSFFKQAAEYCSQNDVSSGLCGKKFLMWVKSMMIKGYPVVFGAMENICMVGDPNDPVCTFPVNRGQSEYDHIISVYAVYSSHKDINTYSGSDIICVADHGLAAGFKPTTLSQAPDISRHLFNFTFDGFLKTRTTTNVLISNGGQYYGIPQTDQFVYGFAVTGPIDTTSVLLPTSVTASITNEFPEVTGVLLRHPQEFIHPAISRR